VAAAGIFAAVTWRCPLGCRHCSTNSANDSEEHDGAAFVRFVGSFTEDCHPDYLLLTGGEALTRPRLVSELACSARAAGTQTYLLTGMFFARNGTIPGPVLRAIKDVDHVAVSIDSFHQEFVPREQVFAAMHLMAAGGTDLSVQLTGWGDGDPELAENVAAVRAEFRDRVPVLAGLVRPYGRARVLSGPAPPPRRPGRAARAALGGPCTFAAWPVIGPDGTITACCNQAVVDGVAGPGDGRPAHLELGNAARDGWPVVRDRCLTTPLLKAVRALGPQASAILAGTGDGDDGYCQACWQLPRSPAAARWAASPAAQPVIALAERRVAAVGQRQGPAGFVGRQGSSRFAGLVLLGRGSG
jgi:hypothetical protein